MSQGYLSVSLSRYKKDFSALWCDFFSFNSFPVCLRSSTPLMHFLSFSCSLLRAAFCSRILLTAFICENVLFFPEKCENSRRKFVCSVQHGIRVPKLTLEIQVV